MKFDKISSFKTMTQSQMKHTVGGYLASEGDTTKTTKPAHWTSNYCSIDTCTDTGNCPGCDCTSDSTWDSFSQD